MTNSSITKRHCIRAFTNQTVEQSVLKSIIEDAAQAPSSKNTQPWQVAVLTGKAKQDLVQQMLTKFDRNEFDGEDYEYMALPMRDDFKARARECGYGLYELKGIARDDKVARTQHFRENYTFFNAPVAMIFHLPKDAQKGTFLDMGFFMQNIMLGLVNHGLGSCPQFSISSYSDTIRQQLGLHDRLIVCGMAVGYSDESAIVNTFIPNRLPITEFTQWFDWGYCLISK